MKKYQTYSVEDFVLDLEFREWVLLPTMESNAFWENFIEKNSAQRESVSKAILLIKEFQIEDITIETEQVRNGIEVINNRIETKNQVFFNPKIIRIAASVALFLGLAIVAWLYYPKPSSSPQVVAIVQEDVMEHIVNPDDKPLAITLPDGSTIVLEKSSEVSFDQAFDKPSREVSLKGQALFDVVKDAQRPFIVYAGKTTTQVVGTSFIVRAFDNENEVKVDVLRGKVKVSSSLVKSSNFETSTENELVLEPNELAIYHEKNQKLVKELSRNPKVIAESTSPEMFVFEEVRVPKIFRTLETAYGVNLVFDKDRYKKCVLTTKLSDETLYQKLDIICKSIGATYKVKGVKIIIKGGDCN